jgi:hypothetical protein
MADSDDDFQPTLEKSRSNIDGRKGHNMQSFHQKAMNAMGKAGRNPRSLSYRASKKPATNRYNAHGRGAKAMRSLPPDTDWQFDHASGQRMRMRQVKVQAYYVK